MRRTRTNLLIASLVAMLRWAPAFAAPSALQDRGDLDPPSTNLRLERIVMVYRHGLRAPLTSEIGARAYARQSWPVWATPNALLTAHGREAMRILGVYDKAVFSSLGLFDGRGCPDKSTLSIYTDSDSRSIASGDELREGMAPGCQILLGHLPPDTPDLTFSADAPGSAPFDGASARASINDYTHGGPGALIASYKPQIHLLEKILDCRENDRPIECNIARISSGLGEGDHGIALEGPIAITSGTAEVFLLQYAEGMPIADVGWGRADLANLTEISRLHALLFDVYDRSQYMARRTAAKLGPRVRSLLTGDGGPKVMIFVGHDNNIAALASLIGATFQLPSG